MMDEYNNCADNSINEKELRQPVWSNMSHEIRTPMNAIMGMSELLLNKVTDAESRECLHSIQIASRDLLMTINNIIDYENAILGQIRLNNVPFNLNDLLNEVINITKINIGDNKVKFYVDADPVFPKLLRGDADRIKQIVAQLLSNASKFTKEGYVKFIVSVGEEDGKARLVFTVVDTGVGMSEKEAKSAFEAYEQCNPSATRKAGGLGIGLSLVKELVTLLNGQIKIVSEPGEGTKVTFSLLVDIEDKTPFELIDNKSEHHVAVLMDDRTESSIIVDTLKKLSIDVVLLENMGELFLEYDKTRLTHLFISHDRYKQIKDIKEIRDLDIVLVVGVEYYREWVYDDSAKFIRKPFWYQGIARALNVDENYMHSNHTNDVLTAKKARVLVVDDNDINLKVSKGLLINHGIVPDTASSGDEAIRMVSKNVYDLVFMDYMMPEMDGIETTRQIRQLGDDYYQRLPIIALSANAIDGAVESFLNAGMDDYMSKPIDRVILEGMLKKWIPAEKITYVRREIVDGKEEKNPFEDFKRIDSASGLFYTNGDVEMYRAILKDFHDAIDDKKNLINSLLEKEDISRFTIEVHSLKSTSKTIGAIDLSDKALELERYGHKREVEKIISEIKNLNQEIDFVRDDLKQIFEEKVVVVEKPEPVKADVREQIRKLYLAADDFDYEEASNLIKEISAFRYQEKIEKICKEINDCVEDIDYEGARMKALEMLVFMQE